MKGLGEWISKNGAHLEPEAQVPHTQPKGQKTLKQKKVPSMRSEWKHLDELNLPLPEVIEVRLEEGTHPKTGARQWQGHYVHGQDRRKVVCAPQQAERLPTAGEKWRVRMNGSRQTVPGMIFGQAEASLEVVDLFDKPEHDVVINDLACHRHRGYGGVWIVDWKVTASVLGSRVLTEVEVPEGMEIPQPGETWRVATKRSYSKRTLRTEAIARLSEPATRPIPTDEFVVFFPDHDNNGDPLEYNGWPLKWNEGRVGHYRCHFKAMDGDALLIETIGFSAEPTKEWITKKLVNGAQVSINFEEYEEEGYDEFGYRGKMLEVHSWDGNNGVNLRLTLKTFDGRQQSVTVNEAVLVGECLLGMCELSRHFHDKERCHVSVY